MPRADNRFVRSCQRLLLEAIHERVPVERQELGVIHLRFIGLQSESWTISLGKPFCTVSPGVTPGSAGLQLFVSASQLDDMLSVGLHKQSLRYVGSVALLDHLVALLKAGQRMIDMRFKHQVFHEADAFREAYASEQSEQSEQWGKG